MRLQPQKASEQQKLVRSYDHNPESYIPIFKRAAAFLESRKYLGQCKLTVDAGSLLPGPRVLRLRVAAGVCASRRCMIS